MLRWVIPIIVLVAGGVLWWWPWGEPVTRASALGTALIAGSVVALVGVYLERRFSHEAEQRDLRLQLGLEKDLSEVDLSYRDLSGFYLAGRNLRGAILREAKLRGANLSGAKLDDAQLNGADLRDAKLDATLLYPSVNLFPAPDLYLVPIYENATTNNTDFREAKFNSGTQVPGNLDLKQRGAVEVKSVWWLVMQPRPSFAWPPFAWPPH